MVVHTRSPLRRRLQPHPLSVGEARRVVRKALHEAGLHQLVEPAELLVSETVTNALVHAGTQMELSVHLEEQAARIAVHDSSPHLPRRRGYGPTAGTGRGLELLDRMAADWGTQRHAEGKLVWFVVSDRPTDHEGSRAAAEQRASRGTRDALSVQLVHPPLLLLQAWQQHVETLLREHLFASLDDSDSDVVISTHAQANDALALLAEQLPAVELDGPEAPAGRQTAPRPDQPVQVAIPTESVTHFRVLCDALDEAHELASRGLLLNYPTQPELRQLSRWLCDQVAEQYAGRDPRPWSLDVGDPPSARSPLAWDTEPVTLATDPVVAADDTNRILAVSRSALELLGYDEPDLVGARLLQVIPERFHEAHLAGFTLYFLADRDALVGRTVTVPARRRDGGEVPVRLTLQAHTVPHGRRVFVAHMHPE